MIIFKLYMVLVLENHVLEINSKVRVIERTFVLDPVKSNILENTNTALQHTDLQYNNISFMRSTQDKFNVVNFFF